MTTQLKNQVRIIGGQWKRRTLKFPTQSGLRPTPDRVRETLFNWLGQDLTGASCLDLFAGSGALGLEAASRHAARVVMVEMGREAVAALREHKTLLKADHVEIIAGDALRYVDSCREQFDLIFLDPPYAVNLLPELLGKIGALLKVDGLIYAECPQWPDLCGWEIIREGRAGQVQHALLRRTTGSSADA
ncbi:16S rRNA (guanine(966)-N(2))-methyltransferase RsmD [Chitinilyticum piscinae]|uniref:16S rRNA (Guanine(966)-N(2))-methyltransferase RsmD n=1 Tax=Chitinilyticum piscinae TaxID=2866724 RepID=A0A8J7K1F8_9NEIS|nr:16S rRNA (guanine(966)-N(2))-methyltransferase RsmD [Chitinilyticum piscinae]MBE9609131.1 16S rRNA (guanine(966)-N(2))-methyltransferase RsmD [Chitinilyticum piscinae]